MSLSTNCTKVALRYQNTDTRTKMHPLVSIIIPVYNAGKFVEDVIKSIESQGVDYEAIFIDDGSTDRGGDIIQEYVKCNPRLRLIRQENAGANNARSKGVSLASGEWITFVDADDLLLSEFSELVNTVCDGFEGDIIFSYPLHLKSPSSDRIIGIDEYCDCILEEKLFTGPVSKLFRRTIFNDFVFDFPNHIVSAEDYLMNVRLALSAQNSVLLASIQYYKIRVDRNPLSAMKTFQGTWKYWEEWDDLLNVSFTEGYRKKHLWSLTHKRLDFWHACCRKRWNLPREYYECQYFKLLKEDIAESGYKVDFYTKMNMRLRNPFLRMMMDFITRINGVGTKYYNKFLQK